MGFVTVRTISTFFTYGKLPHFSPARRTYLLSTAFCSRTLIRNRSLSHQLTRTHGMYVSKHFLVHYCTYLVASCALSVSTASLSSATYKIQALHFFQIRARGSGSTRDVTTPGLRSCEERRAMTSKWKFGRCYDICRAIIDDRRQNKESKKCANNLAVLVRLFLFCWSTSAIARLQRRRTGLEVFHFFFASKFLF